MNRMILSFVLAALLAAGFAVNAYAASLDDIDRKLDQVLKNQETILSELQVVKVRASIR